MIIDDFHVFSARSGPAETYPISIIYANARLTFPVSPERLQSVPLRHAEVLEAHRDLKLPELAPGDRLNADEALDSAAARERLRFRGFERDNHGSIITRRVIIVNRD